MGERVADQIAGLAARLGLPRFVDVCSDLLAGAPREQYVEELRELTGAAWEPGDRLFDRARWGDFWVRSWGARGLLHVWHDSATPSIIAGLGDEHYRPAEMCLKVATRHEVAGTGDGAAALAAHDLPRVRAQALRCLAAMGDTEHAAVVEAALADADVVVRRQAERAQAALVLRLDLESR